MFMNFSRFGDSAFYSLKFKRLGLGLKLLNQISVLLLIMSKSPEELAVKSSSSNSSPINVEDDRRHYLASPRGNELEGDDYFASDTVIVDHCSGSDDGQTEQAIPVSDDEDTGATDQQIQNQDLDPSGQQLETQPVPSFNEIDELSVAGEITIYINNNRINIGELETLEDLWEICDAISAEHGGLPDSLLKESFHIILESYYSQAQNNSWQRQQINRLLSIWRVEMLKEKSSSRPTKFVSAPASDKLVADNQSLNKDANENQEEMVNHTSEQAIEKPQPSSETIKSIKLQKKKERKRKRAIANMGIGNILTNARRNKMITEDAELEVTEDEVGNFLIDGVELSFENWGQLNKIKENDIVHIGVQQSTKRLKGNSLSPPQNGVSSQKNKQSDLILSIAEKYPTVHEVEMPSNDTHDQQVPTSSVSSTDADTSANKELKVKSTIPPPPKEKDEGELSSSESDKPTSSDESSDEANKQSAFILKKNAALLKKNIQENRPQRPVQERRRLKKQNERPQEQQGASSGQNLQLLLQKCFDLRGQIVRKLSIQQKAMFMDLLKQSMAGTLQQGVQNLQQQQAMALLMNTISTSGIGSSSSS